MQNITCDCECLGLPLTIRHSDQRASRAAMTCKIRAAMTCKILTSQIENKSDTHDGSDDVADCVADDDDHDDEY